MRTEQIEALIAENKRLRDVISASAAALPNGAFISPTCTVGFMEGLPEEIKLVCKSLADKIDGLESDLASAVEVAFKHGAVEWTRLNYPKQYAALQSTETNGSDR